MGYTSFMTIKKADRNKFSNVAEKFKKAVDDYLPHGLLYGGRGFGQPEITEKRIWFNGNREIDEDYETFGVKSDDEDKLIFCKTQGKPYDIAVCLILLLFKQEYGDDVEISSDGTSTYIDFDNMEAECTDGRYSWPDAYAIFKEHYLNGEQ